MKLKRLRSGESYPSHECSAARCHAEPTIILATRKLADCDVHLCDRHWSAYCDEDDEREAIEATKREVARLHRFKPGHAPKEPGVWAFKMTDDGLELLE